MALELRPVGAAVASAVNVAPASVAVTVPAGEFWKPTAAFLTIVASATAGTRTVRLDRTTTAEGTPLMLMSALTVTAGQTRNFSFYPGAPAAAAYTNTSYASFPMPAEMMLKETDVLIWTDTANIDGSGDRGTLYVAFTKYQLFEV